MQSPTTQQPEELAERAPRYLDQLLESRDHANQWDVKALLLDSKLEARNDEAE